MMAAERHAPAWRLGALLVGFLALPREHDREVGGLALDSRAVRAGDVFFARAGQRTSGERHVAEAIAAGAAAIVCERPAGAAVWVPGDGVPRIGVPDLDRCIGLVANRFHGEPSAALRVIGITGTNGKTSVSQFVAATLAAGGPCGVVGTLGHGLHGALRPHAHTTPDVLATHALLAEMVAGGARHAVMEVSSHGLHQGRVAGVRFDTAVFTNLSHDHLDYHGTMSEYGATKRRLFETPGLRAAVVNLDDAFGRTLPAAVAAGVQVWGYALAREHAGETGAGQSAGELPAVRGRLLDATPRGLRLQVSTPRGEGELAARLVGPFNASNLLAALAALLVQGLPLDTALARLAEAEPVPGRMQPFGGDTRPLVVVDYAHTPEALAQALAAVRAHCRGRLWCVFGCGGERDRAKRPLMGRIAAEGADAVVVTDDNPRGEDGAGIVDDILAGVSGNARVHVERDRAAAIRLALEGSRAGDVVLVAGKGHEPYQEVAGVRRAYSDAAAVRAALEEWRA